MYWKTSQVSLISCKLKCARIQFHDFFSVFSFRSSTVMAGQQYEELVHVKSWLMFVVSLLNSADMSSLAALWCQDLTVVARFVPAGKPPVQMNSDSNLSHPLNAGLRSEICHTRLVHYSDRAAPMRKYIRPRASQSLNKPMSSALTHRTDRDSDFLSKTS